LPTNGTLPRLTNLLFSFSGRASRLQFFSWFSSPEQIWTPRLTLEMGWHDAHRALGKL
jgi:hypothetical protein